MNRRLAFMLVLALGGCTVGPDYHRPQIDTPADWRAAGEAAEVGNAAWWDQFQDPALSALVTDGVRNSKDLKIATADVERAFAQYGITRSALFPQVDAQASAARERVMREHTVERYAPYIELLYEKAAAVAR